MSRALSAVLTGYYQRRRLTQSALARMTGMSEVSLQKKLDGKAPITATDLVIIAGAIGVDPGEVVAEAKKDLGLSALGIKVDGTMKRPSEMTAEELEALRSAAIRDSELENDEPPST